MTRSSRCSTRLGWDFSERSRLSDAFGFGQADREQGEIAALKARIEELAQAAKDTQDGGADVRLAAAQDEIGSLKQRILELFRGYAAGIHHHGLGDWG